MGESSIKMEKGKFISHNIETLHEDKIPLSSSKGFFHVDGAFYTPGMLDLSIRIFEVFCNLWNKNKSLKIWEIDFLLNTNMSCCNTVSFNKLYIENCNYTFYMGGKISKNHTP